MIDASRLSFLGSGLARVGSATIAVVGAGGGGSHIVQQMAHLSVGIVAVIDPDALENSNVNRVVCTGYGDVKRYKAEVLTERLQGLGGKIVPVLARGESPEGRWWIERSDVVFGAVDGIRARNNLETICRAAFVPYIDIGLTIDMGDDGAVRSIGGQIFVSLPGGPCLRCAGIVTDATMMAHREEYVAGAPEQQVISMNGVLASQAVASALALLADYAPEFPPAALLYYDGLLGTLQPDKHLQGVHCAHFPLSDAGWVVRLPPRTAL